MDTSIDTAVIGAGAAGLTVGYHLRRAGVEHVLLDADARVGDSWRRRYDSLRLFTLPRYASLRGWRIPVRGYPTRDEMADYLEAYAQRFAQPVRSGVRVDSVVRDDGGGFRVATSDGTWLARNVVVATGAHRRAVVPPLADELDPSVRQLTSLRYRGPDQLAAGGVLVVGAANSGTDIALEAAAAGHPTWLAGRHPGQVPIDIDTAVGKASTPAVMFAFRHVLTLRTPPGRALRGNLGHGVNLVRNKLADLDAAGVNRIGRIEAVRDGLPATADGFVPPVRTVVWCTGSVPDHRFLEVPVFGPDGRPREVRGVSEIPGLFFVGLEFQYAVASATLPGFDRDARYVVARLLAPAPAGTAVGPGLAGPRSSSRGSLLRPPATH